MTNSIFTRHGANRASFKDGKEAVEKKKWLDAREYCRQLSKKLRFVLIRELKMSECCELNLNSVFN